MSERRSLYDELGVRETATPAEIKRAWRAVAKRHHPDLARDEADRLERTDRTARINHAKDVLLDRAKRAAYDAEAPPSPWTASARAEPGNRRYAPTGHTYEPATSFWQPPRRPKTLIERLIYIWTGKTPS